MKESKCKTCRFCKEPESFEPIKITFSFSETADRFVPGIFCTRTNVGMGSPADFDNYPNVTECTGWKPKKVKV